MTVITKDVVVESTMLRAWLTSAAYWISQIGSPALTGAGAALLVGLMASEPLGWQWALLYLAITILAPCLYIVWLVQRGAVHDFHLPKRQERIRPLLFSLGAALVGWAYLQQIGAPLGLKMLASVNAVQAILFFLITLRWKISLHCAAAAMLAQLLLLYFGAIATPLIMSVPLIAWSRLHLQRHTLAQTIAGSCLGFAILTPALWFYGY